MPSRPEGDTGSTKFGVFGGPSRVVTALSKPSRIACGPQRTVPSSRRSGTPRPGC